MTDKPASHQEIERLLGHVGAHNVVEIIDRGTTVAELEEVAAHLAQETDVMGELEKPLSGRARLVYDLIRRDEEAFEGDR